MDDSEVIEYIYLTIEYIYFIFASLLPVGWRGVFRDEICHKIS